MVLLAYCKRKRCTKIQQPQPPCKAHCRITVWGQCVGGVKGLWPPQMA